jgi:tetratricopeptide (TPR) repeat protein
MASSARIDELKQRFDENPRRYFAPLANEFRKVGDLEQAILICEAYLPQQPGHMSGHIVYGQALFESNRLDEALGVFQTALSLDPENLIALRHLGDIAARQGDPGSARRWYERVLEADPRNEEIQGLIGALGDDHGAARPESAFATAHTEPPPAPPATPVEAFAAAPDAHFASHDSVVTDVPELLDLDVALPETTPAATAPAEAERSDAAQESERAPDIEATVGDFEKMPETRDLMPPTGVGRGFESAEFEAPTTEIAQEPGLQSAFEEETGIYGASVAPLPGLVGTPGYTSPEPPAPTASAFPELDEPLPADAQQIAPPHGDAVVANAASAAPASPDDDLLDFDMPVAAEAAPPAEATDNATIPPELPPEVIAAAAELIPDEPSPRAEAPAAPSIPTELPPEVIAAEAEVLEASGAAEATVEEATPEVLEAEPEPAPAMQRPFVTETMAELYLKQGFRTEALAVYEQLSAASPSDQRLADKVAALRAEAVPAPAAGPPVREFFARFASRRPWERAAAAAPPSEDDFSADAPEMSEPAAEVAEPAPMSHASEDSRAHAQAPAAAAPAGGSIDALFGNRPTGGTEDSAASALSQAFGGSSSDAPPIAGQPTRPATGELSLDSVFREGGARGPRNSQGFSFDQFFSQNPEGDRTSGGGSASPENPAAGEPAERTADDIEQFNSWLQGLKQR